MGRILDGKKKKRVLRPPLHNAAIIALGIGLILTVQAFLVLRSSEETKASFAFHEAAADCSASVYSAIQEIILIHESLRQLADVTAAKGPMTDLGLYVSPFLERMDGAIALTWVPRVLDSERAAFEAAARENGMESFQIQELDADHVLVRAENRAEYYPIFNALRVPGADTSDKSAGFDIASHPVRNEALQRARNTGETAASARITSLYDTRGTHGFLMISPVYEGGHRPEILEERHESFIGAVTTIFRIADLVEAATAPVHQEGIDFFLNDESAPLAERQLFSHLSPDSPTAGGGVPQPGDISDKYLIDIGGRQWSTVSVPAPGYIEAQTGRSHWTALVAGLILTFLLTTYIQTMLNRSRRITVLADERASALAESQRAQEALRFPRFAVDNASDAVYWVRSDGAIEYANDAACSALGYSTKELTSMSIPQIDPDFPGETWPEHWSEMKEADAMTFEARHKTKEGKVFPVEIVTNYLLYNGEEYICAYARDITLRKQIEAELEQHRNRLEELVDERTAALSASQEKYLSLVNDVPYGIIECDIEGVVSFYNPAFGDMLGYTETEYVGKHLWDIIDSDETKRHFLEFLDGMADLRPTPPPYLCKARTVQGGIIDIRLDLSYKLDKNEKLVGFVSVVTDITESVRAERKIQGITDNLATAQQLAHLGGWERDVTSGTLTWSDELFNIFGFNIHDGQPSMEKFIQAVHAEDRQRILEKVEQIAIDHLPFSLEYRIRREDGYERNLFASAKVVCDDHGNAVRLVGATQDITQRKRMEDRLRANEERFRAILENALDGIVAINEEGRIELFNPAAVKLFGYEAHEVVNQPISTLMPEPFAREHPSYIESYRRTGEAKVIGIGREVTGKRKDGSLFPMYLAVSEYQLDGKWHFVGAIHDLTDRLEAERELESAKEAAEEANLSKSHFLSSMSHELRTPLNGILGFADLLRGQFYGNLNEKQMEYVQHVEHSGKHLLELITDLLDLSKIDVGAIVLDRGPISGETLVESSVEMISLLAREKGITIEKQVEEDIIIDGDQRRCRQILINLLSNAVKFSPRGTRIRIRVDASVESFCTISVIDEGAGIHPADLQKVFSEFYQTDRVRDSQLGGSGIGLALTRRLVELHGGVIDVESTQGQGSTFTFTLPLWHTPASADSPASPFDPRKITLQPNLRILVVEDDELNMKLLVDLLNVHKHRVLVARNGQEAIDSLQEFSPEIILMDMRMPVMNGFDATRQIRKIKKFEKIPIIAISASADPETVRECIEAGCDAHIAKPIKSRDLFIALQRLLLTRS